MKSSCFSRSLFATAALITLAITTTVEARPVYGVSVRRGYAVRGPRGNVAVGRSRTTVVGGRGGVVVAGSRTTVVGGRGGVAVAGVHGAAVVRGPVVAPLPRGFIRTVPVGYSTVVYGGYSCFFVGGIYYRPVIYEGSTVYVVVD